MNEPQKPPVHTGIKRVFKAAIYSKQGFISAFKSEAAFRQELGLCLVLASSLFYLELANLEKLFLLSTLAIVLITELLNSAIEAIVDLVSPEFHELAGKAKDIGSSAVFVSLALAAISWTWAFTKGLQLYPLG